MPNSDDMTVRQVEAGLAKLDAKSLKFARHHGAWTATVHKEAMNYSPLIVGQGATMTDAVRAALYPVGK